MNSNFQLIFSFSIFILLQNLQIHEQCELSFDSDLVIDTESTPKESSLLDNNFLNYDTVPETLPDFSVFNYSNTIKDDVLISQNSYTDVWNYSRYSDFGLYNCNSPFVYDFAVDVENCRFDLFEMADPIRNEHGIIVDVSDDSMETNFEPTGEQADNHHELAPNQNCFYGLQPPKRIKSSKKKASKTRSKVKKSKKTLTSNSNFDAELNYLKGKIFPEKVWLLASDTNFAPIVWNKSGSVIKIYLSELEPYLLKISRSPQFQSFLRQLHLYGFRKTTNFNNKKIDFDCNEHSYMRKHFHRNHYEKLSLIKRH